jgi:uncharacterized integral membrane protein
MGNFVNAAVAKLAPPHPQSSTPRVMLIFLGASIGNLIIVFSLLSRIPEFRRGYQRLQ